MSVLFILSIILAFSYLPKSETADGPQPRIINGIEASIEDFPFQAQLHLKGAIIFDAEGVPPIDIITDAFCGGSIIHNNYILTAAHCLAVNLVGYLDVVIKVGSDLLDQGTASNVIALEFCPHPEYDRSTMTNDIGIIRVNVDLYSTPTPTIAPIKLPQTLYDYDRDLNRELTVSGFGRTSDNSDLSETLRYGLVGVLDSSYCNGPAQYNGAFPETAYCMISTNSDFNTFCNGDSGSPVSYKRDDGVKEQVCIVSFGRPESCSGYLQGCTKIDIYLEWICCVTGGAVCSPDYPCGLPLPFLNCALLPIHPNA